MFRGKLTNFHHGILLIASYSGNDYVNLERSSFDIMACKANGKLCYANFRDVSFINSFSLVLSQKSSEEGPRINMFVTLDEIL